MKNKLLIVSWYGINDVGGVERVTQYMLRVWGEQYDMEVIDLERVKKTSSLYQYLVGRNYALDSILMSIYINKMRKECKNEKIKVITQGYNASFVKSDLSFAHGTMKGIKLAVEGSSVWKLNQLFEKISHNRAKQVVAVSKNVKKELISLYGIPEKKISVLENCVDTNWFHPSEKIRTNKKYKVLFVGRLEKRKGLKLLLQFADLIEKEDDIEFHIATMNKLNVDKFQDFKKTYIHLNLTYKQMRTFYREGDMMFFPSLYEGFEMVTLECLACGTPILGRSIGAIGVLNENGIRGVFIFDQNECINMEKVKEICSGYRKIDVKRKMHEDISSNYSEEIYREKLRKLI